MLTAQIPQNIQGAICADWGQGMWVFLVALRKYGLHVFNSDVLP